MGHRTRPGAAAAWLASGPVMSPAPSLPRVAALLLNWRLPEMTLRCLADLQACGYPDLSILVMDNGSGDGSAELLRREARGAEILTFERNLGYCAAINRGIAWARSVDAPFVLFVNNDMRLPAGFLEPLARVLVNDAEVAGVSPTILRPDGKVWCEGGAIGFHPNLSALRGHGDDPAPTSEGPVLVDFLTGACALYRRSELEQLGGLDESYFMYFEDAELGCRLRTRGSKLLWLPWTRVTHDASASSGGGRSPMRKYMTAVNSVRFLRQHGTAKQWCAFVLFNGLLWPLTWLSGTSWRATLAKGRGIVAGLLGREVTVDDVQRWRPGA